MSRKMKDSGIEWVGEIPESWDLRKGKFLFEQRNEKGNSKELQLLSPTQKYGVIPQNLYEKLSGMKPVKLDVETDYSQMKSIYTGDFCISLRSFQGGFEYSNYNGVVSPAYQVFYKRIDLCDSYYRYMFKDRGFIDKMSSYTKTFRDGKLISFNDFANSLIPIPPLNEQTAIAAYLDRQCTHIDNIIEKTKTSIEEYKKLKQAVITQAVTKGIRGDREMKNSGIEWIGEIPVEWEVTSLKHLAQIRTGNTPSKAEQSLFYSDKQGVPWIKAEDLGNNCSIQNTSEYLTEEGRKLGRVFPPCTVYICCIASVGKVGFSEIECSCNQQINALIFNNKYWWKYGFYVSFSQEIEYIINSSGNVMRIINLEKQGQLKCPVPNLLEQKEVAAYLDQKCADIDAIIANKQQFITEMKTYKKSTIYEYVTGKKEVPTC